MRLYLLIALSLCVMLCVPSAPAWAEDSANPRASAPEASDGEFPRARSSEELELAAVLTKLPTAEQMESTTLEATPEPASPREVLAPALEARPVGLDALLLAERRATQRCVQWAEQRSGAQHGRLEVELFVEADGTVSSVRQIRRRVGSDLASCLRKRAAKWAFPAQPERRKFVQTWVFD